MSIWEGIEESSNPAQRVWFSKGPKDSDPWVPLRKCDSKTLNEALNVYTRKKGEEHKVVIESGRATVDMEENLIHCNFHEAPKRRLASSIWFQVKDTSEKNNKENLIPIISRDDEDLIENLYQEGVNILKEGDNTAEKLSSKQVELKDDNLYKIYIAVSSSGALRMRKRRKHFISLEGHYDLQRGYGDYNVDGEEEELALDPVRHLSFIIHGIGEAMWSREEASTASLIDEVNTLRSTVNKKMYSDWKRDCEKCDVSPPPPNRMEFIPIEWYGSIHSSSSTLKRDLKLTTLTTVSKLRNIANDVLFDVLVYNTPEFCEKVLDCVTNKICVSYNRFQDIHKDFSTNNGTCSLVGHSLGSVIAWDLLSILSDNLETGKGKEMSDLLHNHNGKGTEDDPIIINAYSLPTQNKSSSAAYEAYLTQTASKVDESQLDTWGPSLLNKMTKTIPFVPSFTFFLGSPIGLFLTLRGARSRFNDMLLNTTESVGDDDSYEDEYHKTSPFCLPSGSIYNIFSPSDPVAYRIEPLLLPSSDSNQEVPPPCFLVSGGKGLRFHVKAKEIGDTFIKSFTGILKNPLEKIPDKIGESFSSDSSSKQNKKKSLKWKFALGGQSDRVDYQLQPGVVENEYLAAISAHNSYMRNSDLIEFWIDCAQQSNASSVICWV